ncbi:uncharacterized protein C2845_PM01G07380 [Panicum miliaceum]|uniref:Protein root UVB sensitive/RUS domain-containing protein n=1 Tax=Panicum miliaceum TaxID=4540 RepID=A0A3L6TK97_PANMI|nr:uncharacterized protein C2845_PM01G07380 [Panicum miliaceum]
MDAPHPQGEAAAEWVTVEEWSGSSASALSRTAVLTASASSLTSRRFGSRWGRIGGRMLGAFVPEGFPGSVTPDYVPFQTWDTLQGLSTYIRAMLSTQWFLRDLTGMLGGILFTFYQGSNLDRNAKMWRLVADFMNDLGMLMDLLSPLFPSSLIVIMCLGSLSRSFTGVASGATRAALTQHFALANNAADISAKEGSQETLATMTGMGLGMLLAHITRGHALSVWASFLSLTVFHMYANYKAVQSLSLTTLNCERASILLQYFKECSEANYLLLDKEGSVHIFIHKQATPADVLKSFIHGLVLINLAQNGKSQHTEARRWMDDKYTTFISKLQVKGYSSERLLSHSIVWRAHWLHGQLDEKLK